MTTPAVSDQPEHPVLAAPVQQGRHAGQAEHSHRVHQIYYSDDTRALLDPGFIALDNTGNARPDWREYWPIRQALRAGLPAGEGFIGFLSPKFGYKTGLQAQDVFATICDRGASADVIGFCSYFDQAAYFTNVFEHGESVHGGGFTEAAQGLLDVLGVRTRVADLLMGSGTSIYCNYFVAKSAFWRIWLEWNDILFAIAEANDTALGRQLNMPVPYLDITLPMKVFIMERTVSLILATQPHWRVQAFDPYRMSGISPALMRHPLELIQLDALKVAWRDHAFPAYRQAFYQTRARLNEKLVRDKEAEQAPR